MSEAEFNLLLDNVRDAMMHDAFIEDAFGDEASAPAPSNGFVLPAWSRAGAPKAANDNEGAWPLLPFPDGWYAAC